MYCFTEGELKPSTYPFLFGPSSLHTYSYISRVSHSHEVALQNVGQKWWAFPTVIRCGKGWQPAFGACSSRLTYQLLQVWDWGQGKSVLEKPFTPTITHSLSHSGNVCIHPASTLSLWTPGSNPVWKEKKLINGLGCELEKHPKSRTPPPA